MSTRHNLTRRALLGAGAGACVAAAAPHASRAPGGASAGPPASAESRASSAATWARALGRYRRADARLAAFRRQVDRLPEEQRAFPACQPWEDRFDDLESARLAALRRLLALPAPDGPALALKLELTIGDQAWELSGAETFLASLKADAARLIHAS